MAITKIPAAGFTGNNFRNIIINGDMSIAQRGTSQANAGSSSGSYETLDRFALSINNLGSFTWSQDTDVPTGQGFATSMKLDCTTADASPASTDYLNLQHRIEGQNLQYLKKGTSSAESLTLSFWVKCNKTGNIQVNLRDLDNSRMISYTATIDASNTWEKKTVTFDGDTIGTLDNDNAESFRLEWWLDGGSTYSSGTFSSSWTSFAGANRNVNGTLALADDTANNFWITGVQLEAGTTASDFEFLPYDVNLQRCQRYCQTIYATGGNSVISVFHVTGTAGAIGSIPNLIEMRGTATFSTTGSFNIWTATAGSNAAGTLSLFSSSKTQQGVSFTKTSGGTLAAGQAGGLFSSAGSSSILLSAEL